VIRLTKAFLLISKSGWSNSASALNALNRHLWYLAEEAVAMSLWSNKLPKLLLLLTKLRPKLILTIIYRYDLQCFLNSQQTLILHHWRILLESIPQQFSIYMESLMHGWKLMSLNGKSQQNIKKENKCLHILKSQILCWTKCYTNYWLQWLLNWKQTKSKSFEVCRKPSTTAKQFGKIKTRRLLEKINNLLTNTKIKNFYFGKFLKIDSTVLSSFQYWWK